MSQDGTAAEGRHHTADEEFRADLLSGSRIASVGTWVSVLGAAGLYFAGSLPRMRPGPLFLSALGIQVTAWITSALAMTVPRPLALYFAFHLLDIVCATSGVFFAGGWFCPVPGLFYALIVVDGGSAGGVPAHVLATVGAAAYAGMLAVQRIVQPLDVPLVDQVANVTMMAIGLNLIAAYTGRLAALLRARRAALTAANGELETRVAQRTSELEAERRALEEQSDRLRRVLYVLTHDLKNPVNAIHLRADLLLTGGDGTLPRPVRAGVERIAEQAAATERKIGNLMDLFRITSRHEPERWMDLNEVIVHALEPLQPRIAEKGVRVDVERLPVVRGQPGKLLHIAGNLLSNALKYVPRATGRVTVRGGEDGGAFWLAVEDNGIGIAEEYQEGIFELFRRVPDAEQVVDGEVVPGSGVGLALVKELAEQHGGSVVVRSRVGAGSCFEVRFGGRAVH